MSIKKSKKIIYIYCEGPSERNYFEALKRNKFISSNYVLKPQAKTNDLDIAIRKSRSLEGIPVIVLYVFDSDKFKNQKKISEKIKQKKECVYFSEENFEDFLDCHKTKKPYRGKKPHLSRQLIDEVRILDKNYLKKCIKKPKKFKEFKSIYELLEELFEQKL